MSRRKKPEMLITDSYLQLTVDSAVQEQ